MQRNQPKIVEKIHKESNYTSKLPFTFSKPFKAKRQQCFVCTECGKSIYAPINTIMCVCNNCKKVTKVVVKNGESDEC